MTEPSCPRCLMPESAMTEGRATCPNCGYVLRWSDQPSPDPAPEGPVGQAGGFAPQPGLDLNPLSPAPVGLTEDERRKAIRDGLHRWLEWHHEGVEGDYDEGAGFIIDALDRLSAAPVDDRERVPEGWRVEWRTEEPHGPGEGPREVPYLAQIPMAVSPSVDPEDASDV